jgi:hypothetical protein
MKKIYSIITFLVLSTVFSCKQNFLDEKPKDFLSSSNAYVTLADFNAAIVDMYRVVRTEFYTRDENYPFDYLYGCDIVYDGEPQPQRHSNMAAAYQPSGGPNIPLTHWSAFYKIIAEANAVIGRAPGSAMTDVQKTLAIAKGRFFRAFAYRSLVYLYGGVPLILEETTTPKTDFVRATKPEVLNQCIEDLKFASANLAAINTVQDGEINTAAATHLLSEVYLAAGQFQNAIDAAGIVINSSTVSLMRNRFGSKSTVATGNVYWDLFQPGNQNRKSGNLEGLWVVQLETDVPGGGSLSTQQAGNYLLERQHAPYLAQITKVPNPFLHPIDDLTGGRGIGWAISTNYFSNVIWQSDFNNDIRNANINFVRNFVSTNPASPLFGTVISTATPPSGMTVPSRPFYAFQAKCTTPGGHPANLIQNPLNGLMKATAGGTYLDQYMFRLAETYLIRAEAYLGLGNTSSAAADINTVRARSSANPVAPANVNIDYILDERMREFGVEEKRRLTLMRLGLWYDRVKKCNPYYSDALPKYNLWPIPADEIERNNTGKLTQNPGY